MVLLPLQLAGIGVLSAFTAAAVTRLALQYAHQKQILDVPNHRSSHSVPTPRGGGISIAAVTLVTLVALVWRLLLPIGLGYTMIATGALIAATGAWDDVGNVSVRLRLLIQLAASALASCVILWSTPAVTVLGWPLVVLIGVFVVIATVWMTNLYNFMDGIDGIAGLQAVVAGVAAAIIFYKAGEGSGAAIACAVTGGATGFLLFNWPPARIFMGDVGSAFLGFVFSLLVFFGLRYGIPVAVALTLPLLPFITDTTFTLLYRIARGAPSATAHREHVYQLAVQSGLPHRTVTLVAGLLSATLAYAAIMMVDNTRLFIPILVASVTGMIFLHIVLRSILRKRLPLRFAAGE